MTSLQDKANVWQSLRRSHAATFGFLLPFIVMLALHRLLGLTYEMAASPPPPAKRDPVSATYNLAMGLVFYAGICGFIGHGIWLRERGRGWVIGKLVVLAVAWTALLVFWQT